jgi:hypothetical protein
VASLGAFEHFCSPEDNRAGRQDELYRGLFARIGSVLPDKGRFFLQTMVFGWSMIPAERIDIRAPRGSDAWYLALMGRAVPGSWLPHRQEQIIRSAEPHFRLVSSMSGRLDYIETIRQWGSASRRRGSRRRCSSSSFYRAGLRAPISGSRSPRASALPASASSASWWITIGWCSRRSLAVWLTDSVACGRVGPGALVRVGDG